MKLYTCISVYMTHMFWFEVNHESRLAMKPRRFSLPHRGRDKCIYKILYTRRFLHVQCKEEKEKYEIK